MLYHESDMNFDDIKEKYCDIDLILQDETNNLVIHSHKIILICNSNYFRDLLFQTSNIKELTINIIDCRVAHDVINFFYGIKFDENKLMNWNYVLKLFVIRNFFDLENDLSLLYRLEIPEKDLVPFVEEINKFEFCKNPDVRAIVKKFTSKKLILVNKKWIKICNIDTGSVLHTIHGSFNLKKMEITCDRKNVMFAKSKNLEILDLYQGISKKITNDSKIACFASSKCGNFVVTNSYNSIKIWNLKNFEFVKEFKIGQSLKNIFLCYDNSRIYTLSENNLRSWDFNGEFINSIVIFRHFHDGILSSDNKYFILYGNHIKIYDLETGRISLTINHNFHYIHKVIIHDYDLIYTHFSDINIYNLKSCKTRILKGHNTDVIDVTIIKFRLVSLDKNGNIIIWDLKMGQIILNFCIDNVNKIYFA